MAFTRNTLMMQRALLRGGQRFPQATVFYCNASWAEALQAAEINNEILLLNVIPMRVPQGRLDDGLHRKYNSVLQVDFWVHQNACLSRMRLELMSGVPQMMQDLNLKTSSESSMSQGRVVRTPFRTIQLSTIRLRWHKTSLGLVPTRIGLSSI